MGMTTSRLGQNKRFDPMDESTWPSEKEAMISRIARQAIIAANEMPDASTEELASLLEIAIDPESRSDCRATYEAAFAYFAQYLEIGTAICAAMVLHESGPQQRLMLGTLAHSLKAAA